MLIHSLPDTFTKYLRLLVHLSRAGFVIDNLQFQSQCQATRHSHHNNRKSFAWRPRSLPVESSNLNLCPHASFLIPYEPATTQTGKIMSEGSFLTPEGLLTTSSIRHYKMLAYSPTHSIRVEISGSLVMIMNNESWESIKERKCNHCRPSSVRMIHLEEQEFHEDIGCKKRQRKLAKLLWFGKCSLSQCYHLKKHIS